jgi:hypothetical protein
MENVLETRMMMEFSQLIQVTYPPFKGGFPSRPQTREKYQDFWMDVRPLWSKWSTEYRNARWMD